MIEKILILSNMSEYSTLDFATKPLSLRQPMTNALKGVDEPMVVCSWPLRSAHHCSAAHVIKYHS